MQQLHDKSWEVGKALVPPSSACNPHGVQATLQLNVNWRMETFWIACSHLPQSQHHSLLFCGAKGLLAISVVPSGEMCTQAQHKQKFPAWLTLKAERTSWIPQFRNIFVWLTVEFAPTLISHDFPSLILQPCELSLRHMCQFPTIVLPESFILKFPILFSYLLKCLSRISIIFVFTLLVSQFCLSKNGWRYCLALQDCHEDY